MPSSESIPLTTSTSSVREQRRSFMAGRRNRATPRLRRAGPLSRKSRKAQPGIARSGSLGRRPCLGRSAHDHEEGDVQDAYRPADIPDSYITSLELASLGRKSPELPHLPLGIHTSQRAKAGRGPRYSRIPGDVTRQLRHCKSGEFQASIRRIAIRRYGRLNCAEADLDKLSSVSGWSSIPARAGRRGR